MTNEDQIRTIIEEWAKAAREENMDGVLKHHSRDIVMFDLPHPLQSKGMEEYKKTWELFFNWTKQSKIFDIVEMEITATNDLAFCYGIIHCLGKNKDGAIEEFDFRLTMCLKKENNNWLICHEHHSSPIE